MLLIAFSFLRPTKVTIKVVEHFADYKTLERNREICLEYLAKVYLNRCIRLYNHTLNVHSSEYRWRLRSKNNSEYVYVVCKGTATAAKSTMLYTS